ncbi:hypothetical protein C5E02_10695 [Rathayibacter rathayi]|uniref:IS3 family transposase n=1 Tax=Rathayibacter rathayi TaxID=33887 RepID=A0ABD6W697_RATRA|nr:hypothetical protein C1O28_10990 [Rathayibacter rathayi]PPF11018.1 hypothetical protein C5C04_12650 [Rathayibacter rathayi]PPF44604.1 hypothetical protein C5C08_13150 [Rathayibacter rathayi]PPF77313.1 hypothetical protein C5C14_12705 [Rathayibacter rathayi]PPG12377.1 hypothetical protein C5C11_09835 [Rathayibacter rathayi]
MIDRLRAEFPVTYLCQKLRVSTSGFYDWVIASPTRTAERREQLTARVGEALRHRVERRGIGKGLRLCTARMLQ